jgi:MSHA biogenesis protein MshJ
MKLVEHPQIKPLLLRYQQMTTREQQLFSLTCRFLLVMLVALLVLDPLWRNSQQKHQQLVVGQDLIVKMQAQIEQMRRNPVADPNPSLREQQRQLTQQLQMIKDKNQSQTDQIISPRDMAIMLEQVLAQTPQLQLQSLENLDPQPLLVDHNASPGGPSVNAGSGAINNVNNTINNIVNSAVTPDTRVVNSENAVVEGEVVLWRHGLRLQLRATWPATLDYLHRMLQLPGKLYWEKLEFHLDEYPWGELTLEVFSISASKEVVGA